MKFIEICKASPITKNDPVQAVNIRIDDELPTFPDLQDQDFFTSQQARELEESLYLSLPGATYDRLLGLMLGRKATHFRVAHK